jgi:hypothetical protein
LQDLFTMLSKLTALKLQCAYNYIPQLVEGLEDKRRTMIIPYLSADLGHQFLVKFPGQGDHTFEFDNIAIPKDIKYGEPFIAADSGMTIRFFCAGKNKEGTAVMTQAGSVFIPSTELFSNTQTLDTGLMDITVPNAADHERGVVPTKGKFQLIVNRTDFPLGRNPVKPVSQYDYVPQNGDKFGAALVHYMERAGLVYAELAPTFSNAVGLRMPWWVSGHLQAPGVAFSAPRADPSTEKWWEKGIIAAARRYHPEFRTDSQATEWLLSPRTTESEIMCTAMLHHTAVVTNATAYVADGIWIQKGDVISISSSKSLAKKPMQDQIKARAFPKLKPVHLAARPRPVKNAAHFTPQNVEFLGMEDFSLGLLRVAHCPDWKCLSSADCEDCGAEIALMAHSLRSTPFQGQLMRRIQGIRENYVICQTLMYVNADEIANGGRGNGTGGHMAAAYVTTQHMNNMLEEGSNVKPVYEGFMRRQGSIPKDYLENPVIFGEGTGLMFPLANDTRAAEMENNINYLAIKYLLKEQSRYIMPHSKTQPNAFYNTMLSICPLEFADKYANVEQIMVKTGIIGKPTIGVDYLEFLNGHSRVGLIPAAPMTETELMMVRSLLKHAPPIPAHRESSRPLPVSHPILDQLVAHCKSLRRSPHSVQDVEYHQQFFREDYITESALKIMQDAITAKSRVFQISYRPEDFGENLRSYAVVFHMNP